MDGDGKTSGKRSGADDLIPVRERGTHQDCALACIHPGWYGKTGPELTAVTCGACGKGWWCERNFFLKLFILSSF